MGEILSKLKGPLHYASGSVSQIITGRKRKREEDDSSDKISEAIEKSLHVAKKKKLYTTSRYIYQALFKEQKNSDIAVMALGKVWYLHKVYLCQSPYFASMFNGSWRESCQDFIHIKILDPKITVDSLEAVFGSLYQDEVQIEPVAVVSVLATATLFQLEGIIATCSEIMLETINAQTVVPYYEAASQYGLKNVKTESFKWLLVNLLNFYCKQSKYLSQINADLMVELVSHPDLYVLQTEFSVYILLRTWMFLYFYPNYEPNDPVTEDTLTPRKYFSERTDETPFLYTQDGAYFLKAFQALRMPHLLNHHVDLRMVMEDNIIPKEWLHDHIMNHWNSILKVDQMLENGPGDLNEEVFFKNCSRFGRVLPECSYQKWRWTGFNFGLDLVLIADSRVINIKRHHRAENERLLSLQTKRKFMIRVTVVSLNEQRQPIHTQTTGLKTLCLEKNEETSLMLLDKQLNHPLLISVNLLVVSPNSTKENENNKEKETQNTQVPISEIGASADPPPLAATSSAQSAQSSPENS